MSGRIEKKSYYNNNCNFTKKNLIDLGSSFEGKITICSECHEKLDYIQRRSKEDVERVTTMKCYHWTINNKTIKTYWQCSKCKHKYEESHIYRSSKKSMPINDIRKLIKSRILMNFDFIKKNWKDRKLYDVYFYELEGSIKAYMDVLELLGGK